MAIAIWNIDSGVADSFIDAYELVERIFVLSYSIGEEIEFPFTLKLFFERCNLS